MTEAAIATLNAQELFEKTARHLFAQGKRWVGPSAHSTKTICRYRTDDGLSCAVGCHIPDDVYTSAMEGRNAGDLIENFRNNVGFLRPHTNLLTELQSIHDADGHWASSIQMREALEDLATAWDLDGTFLAALSFSDR
jgi:hypothetical protein